MTNPGESGEALPVADWQWLADQLRAWPERRVHPERTMCEGVLRPMAADVIEEALRLAATRPEPAAVGVRAVVDQAQFLCDRLDDLEWHDGALEDTARDYMGHVDPAHARLKATLEALALIPACDVGEVERLRELLGKYQLFAGETAGKCLGLAMSENHPEPDTVLMSIFEASQALAAEARATLSRPVEAQ